MMDFTGRGHEEAGLENHEELSNELGQAPALAVAQAGLGAQQTLIVGPDNVVRLPAGVSLDALSVDGRDLIITLEDGSVIRIPDGAIIVPQFEVEGVTVPPQNIAALLTGNEPAPEAGAVQSSGGNFAGDVGDIQDAYGLGDLLPYTELAFPQYPDREIIPAIADEEPDIVIVTPDNPSGAVDATAEVNEAGLPARDGESAGSNSASDSEITNGTIVYDTPDGFMSLSINGVAVTAVGQTFAGQYGTLTITSIGNGEAGYRYVLADNTLDVDVDSFTVTVTDTDGDSASASLDISIIDDQPDAIDDTALTIVEGDQTGVSGNVMGNDVQGADGAHVTSVTIGGTSYSVAASGTTAVTTANGDYTFDAAGNWTFHPVGDFDQSNGPVDASFTYTLTDGDGDTDTAKQPISIVEGVGPSAGEPISLTVDDQNLADGSDPAAPVTDSAAIAFTPGSDAISSIVFDGSATALDNLGGGLTWERVSDTQIVGRSGGDVIVTLDLSVSGTTATVTVTLNDNYALHPDLGDDLAALGSVLVVATDTDGDQASSAVAVSVSDDLPTLSTSAPEAGTLEVDESNLGTDATADFSGLFTPDYNADGPGDVSGYSLGINAGATGLVDTLSGEAVVLTLESGQVVGRTAVGGDIVFVVSVDASGAVTLDQQRAVVHADTADHDDATGLADPDLITLSATVTDGDGDTATATVSLGDALSFRDDGPAIDAALVDGDTIVLTTQDADTIGEASDTDTTTANFGDAFSVASSSYGADGAGSVAWNYAFVIDSPDSGLTSNGVAVTLAFDGSDIVGSAGDTEVFRLSVDPSTGVVTLTQYEAIDHALPGEGAAPYDDQFAVLADGVLSLQGTATIVDGDGDEASETVALDLGGNVQFADDGPSVTTDGTPEPLIVDDSNFAVDASTDYSNLFTFAYGADGAAAGGGESYALGISAGATGLVDTLSGEDVVLTLESGQVVGRTAVGGAIVFVVSVDASGTVTLDQQRAVYHSDPTADNEPTGLASGDLITLTATATDGDGDSDSETIAIGDDLVFLDDAPAGVADSANVTEGGTIALGDEPSVLANDQGGADGIGSVVGVRADGDPADTTTSVTGGTGTPIVGDYGTLTLNTDGSYTYTANSNIPEDPATDVFVYTFVDGDGDIATTTLTINVNQVNLVADNRDEMVYEAALDLAADDDDLAPGSVVGSDPTSTGETIGGTLNVTGGVGTITYALDAGQTGTYGQIEINADGTWTYTLTDPVDGDTLVPSEGGDNGPNVYENIESFTYTATDANGNTVQGTITIDVTDDVPSVTVTGAIPSLSVDDSNFGVNDSADYSNVFTFAYGADGAAAGGGESYALDIAAGATGLTDTLSGEAVVLTLEGGQVVGRTSVGGAIVFVVSVDASGTVTLDQQRAVVHSDPNNANETTTLASDGLITLTATGTDGDGDSDSETIAIGQDLTFFDDAPTAGSNLAVQLDDETLPGGIASGTGDVDPNTANTSGTLAHSFGNDGGSLAFLTTGAPAGFQYVASGSNILVQQLQGGNWVTVVTVTLNTATGAYTVTQNDNVLHTAGNAENDASFTLTYRVTDGDLDHADGTLTINVDDDTPTANALASLTGSVDEDALPGGIEGGAGDIGVVGLTTGGSVAAMFNSGADSPLSYGFETAASTQTYLTGLGLTSGNVALSYVVSAGSIVATAGGSPVFTITLSATGTWAFTLQGALDHPTIGTEDNIDINFGGLVVATDADGDRVTGTGSLVVTVDDDTPVAFVPTTASVNNAAGPVSAPIALHFDAAAGADDVGDVVFDITNGTPLVDTNGNALKLGGEELYLQNVAGSDGHIIEARTGDGDLAFTATLNPDGDSYTIDLDGTIYNSEQFSFTNLSGTVGGGNVNYKGLGIGSGGTQDILISGNGSVNTNATEIGISSGNDLGTGDVVRFDMVSNLAVAPSAPANGNTGFTHTGHYEVSSYIQAISFVQGGGSNTTGFTVTIRNGDGDFSYLGDGTGESAPPDITVKVYSGDPALGGTLLATFTDADNNVVVTGVKQGNYIEVTSSDPFSIVEYSNQTGRPYKLGAILIETANTLNPFDISLPITGTDGDGDSVDSSITLHLNPVIGPVVLDVDGGGNHFTSAAAGQTYDYLGDGTAESTAWVGKGSAILVHDANHDGMVNGATEFAFGHDGLTDLEAVAASYDGNSDGVLDSSDAAYASFGVWIDANLDAKFDAGEFVSLADAGIASINLVSNDNESQAADGSVTIFGETTFTWADGSTGVVADAAFRADDGQVATSTSTAALGGDTTREAADLRQDYRAFELAAIAAGAGFAIHQVPASFADQPFAQAASLDQVPQAWVEAMVQTSEADAGFRQGLGSIELPNAHIVDFRMAAHSSSFERFDSAQLNDSLQAMDGGRSAVPFATDADFQQPVAPGFASALPFTNAMAGMEQLLALAQQGAQGVAADQPNAQGALAQIAQDVGMDNLIDHFASAVGQAQGAGPAFFAEAPQMAAFLDQQVGPHNAGVPALDILHDAAAMAEAVTHA